MISKLTAASCAALLGATLLACGAPPGEGADTPGSVTFVGWGGQGQEAMTTMFFEPFSEETGIGITQDTGSSPTKLAQMVDAGQVIWDVMDYGAEIGLTDNPDLEEIDCAVVACADFDEGLFPAYPQGVPLYVLGIVLTYNTDLVTEAPQTRADALFDTTTYPGKRAFNGIGGTYTSLLTTALIADGVDQDELYPLDIERALRKIETIRDDIIVYQESSQCVNLVASGEAVFGDCYNGRAKLARDEGLPIDYIWSQQALVADYVMVPRGTPNRENAMQLVAYLTDRENSGRFSELMAYAGGNPHATVDEEFRENSPIENAGDGVHRPVPPGLDWWPDNRETVIDRMAEWFNE
ncbi:ABC transporter substrate-binding protein [Pseudonocardia kongjuensis]|uniref:ABC transporter substrate-binding protein n=1 Tax=Pseudonocardia kongjuensis TaxID=102227 RepID=A0ABN1XGC1_9PSEU